MDGELKKVAEQALSLKPNFAYTLKEIRGEMEQIFDTGFFSLAAPKAEDTRDGVKITVQVRSKAQRSVSPPLFLRQLGRTPLVRCAYSTLAVWQAELRQPHAFATSMPGPSLHQENWQSTMPDAAS